MKYKVTVEVENPDTKAYDKWEKVYEQTFAEVNVSDLAVFLNQLNAAPPVIKKGQFIQESEGAK